MQEKCWWPSAVMLQNQYTVGLIFHCSDTLTIVQYFLPFCLKERKKKTMKEKKKVVNKSPFSCGSLSSYALPVHVDDGFVFAATNS